MTAFASGGCTGGQIYSTAANNGIGGCVSTYNQWIKSVWDWSLIILIPLSTLLLSAAGIIYMVSGGDPTRVKLAKKIVVGVASGVGLIILARVIFNVLGVMPAWNV